MSTWLCLHCGTVNKWPRGFVVVCSHWSVSMWSCYFPAKRPALFPLVSVHVALLLSRQNSCPLPIGQSSYDLRPPLPHPGHHRGQDVPSIPRSILCPRRSLNPALALPSILLPPSPPP